MSDSEDPIDPVEPGEDHQPTEADRPGSADTAKRPTRSTGCQLVLLVGCVAVVFGCLLGLSATGAHLFTPSGWERTTATLGGSEAERRPGTTESTYHRRYTFTANDGNAYTVTVERETRGREGSTLPVTYNPDHPKEAYLDGFVETFKRIGWGAVLLVIALASLALAVALAVDVTRHALRAIRSKAAPGAGEDN